MESKIKYSITRSLRSHSIRIAIYPDCKIKVTAPSLMPAFLIRKFVHGKSDWIEKKVRFFKDHKFSSRRIFLKSLSRQDYIINRERAYDLVTERLEHFNIHYGFTYKKVIIRDQKSRWGSCSHGGNISINFRIVFLSKEIQDYIVVHELCHLKEMNHSSRFWSLVGEVLPEFKRIRKDLKNL